MTAPPPSNGVVLELADVSKFFGSFKAVDAISLKIPAGSIYGFLGPNGAGKTTTIRMILDILRPSSGTIRILGAPSALQVRNRVGYLPEEKGLYKKMKTWAIVAYFASLKGLSRSQARRRAFELLERYGLGDFARARTDALSKGMGQKVQMIASIAHDPELVILDEPFSGLDPVNQQVMEDIIRDMARRGRTVLFSTHVMQHAERLCDRILLIAKGRKIFDGTVAEARCTLPRRVRLATAEDVTRLRELPGVVSLKPVPEPVAVPSGTPHGDLRRWDLEIRESTDPQGILQTCFAQGIRLASFELAESTLHDVFVHLVGPEAREAELR
jgi:ABC-2 type transport system ATP-binding protein